MSPWIVRNLLFPLHERVLGKRTRQFLRELEASQSWPIEKFRELQIRKLAALVAYAQSKVPYFGRLFAEHGIRATSIQDFDDFRRIPLMTKQTIRDHLDDLMPTGYRGRIVPVATGGSTGEPLQLYNDMIRIARCDAARHRVYRWYGANIGEREVALWGSPADLSKMDRLRLVRDRFLNTRLLRAFGLDEATMDKYVEFLSSYRPRKIYAYVSCAYVMALRMINTKARLPEPPAVIIVTAEPLYDFQRKAIEEAFQTRVSVEYGCRDGGLIAGQCPSGGIHLNAELNYVELGPAGAQRMPDGSSEVVVTNLDAHVVPIIRYRTGDLAVPGKGKCACGRELPLLQSIQGRSTDFLVAPDGKLIHALAVIYAVRTVPGVEQFRVHQSGPRLLDVQLQTSTAFDQHAIEQIRRNMAKVFDNQVKVDISLVERIDAGPAGKFRYVSSSVRSPLLNPQPARASEPRPQA
jgi:phenylacetate-CoA ligase